MQRDNQNENLVQKYDFQQHRTENCVKFSQSETNSSVNFSDSDEEDDNLMAILPRFEDDKNEFRNLFQLIPEPGAQVSGNSQLQRAIEVTMDIHKTKEGKEHFYVYSKRSKVSHLLSLPNSVLPHIKGSDTQTVFPPTYLIDEELEELREPFSIESNQYLIIKDEGLFFEIKEREDKDQQVLFVKAQRNFYSKIYDAKIRGAFNMNRKLNFPIFVYEGRSILVRFCDIFSFFPVVFDEISLFIKNTNDGTNLENLVLEKITNAIVAGVNKVAGSQGIPLDAILGETYQNKYSEFRIYAEVRKTDFPIKIAYNITYEERMILINGTAIINQKFVDREDKLIIQIESYNKMTLIVPQTPV
jgi:hypothetical protein